MFIDQAALDWLTLTTWHAPTWPKLDAIARGMGIKSPVEDRRMQYRGLSSGGVFWGEALQQGVKHFMLQASGMDAELIGPRLLGLGLKCTRLDVQITSSKPKDWQAIGVANQIRAYPPNSWPSGQMRMVTVIQSGDGFDTIYVGSRASDRYCRIYVKPDDLGRAYLRFEMEYKGALADTAWRTLNDSDDPVADMANTLLQEIEDIPGLYGLLPEAMLAGLRLGRPGATWKPPTRIASGGAGLAWLTRQVQPAIMRLMADHDQGPGVRNLVRAWCAEADMIDELVEQLISDLDHSLTKGV